MSAERQDDRLTGTEAAELLGIKPVTWRAYVKRGQRPKPDGYLDKRTPYWLRSTVLATLSGRADAEVLDEEARARLRHRIDESPRATGEVIWGSQEQTTMAELLGTLDELAAAARAGDLAGYRRALEVASRQEISSEQITDAYRWGRRALGAAGFDAQGSEVQGTKGATTTERES